MDSVEKKEIMQTAAQRAKAAVEGAQDQAGQEVQQATQEAKGKLGLKDSARPPAAAASPSPFAPPTSTSRVSGGFGDTPTLERRPTGAAGVLSGSKFASGSSKHASFRRSSDNASSMARQPTAELPDEVTAPPEISGPVHKSNPKHVQVEEQEDSGDSTPSSARASQGVVGGFMFRPSTPYEEHDEDEDDDDEDDEDETEGPTNEDVTASMDEAQDQALMASESNRHLVEQTAADVKGSLKKEK
ncbi:hypothetical protein WJX73_009045 [Symbiochloris irregularis]|uniref:Uncharacterized protein n=1 Tax=Symbiochloris irregularis TaxID=706552 RepID=A0AAW1NTW3_9CHLO